MKIQTASESRKIRKPMMEKKRRARINDSLESLKKILLEFDPESGKKTGQKTAKLEKADILEMTVRYLENLRSSSLVPKRQQVYSFSPKQEIKISPADSSTNDGASKATLGEPLVPDSARIPVTNSYFQSSSVPSCSAFFSRVACLPTKYNSGGVVYMWPKWQFSNQQQFSGQVSHSSNGQSDNVWRPW
ncbi:hypothetical protein NQ317_012157 [Molorchus minor]|uniref:BHLH domain-containing protein n=1 Tax=Molorchus minor TaxID=1323400 RepID=A0ABQ9K4C4_9CUCU|nr:hypothetical protein NQ317_012157 [Molorchus minor]